MFSPPQAAGSLGLESPSDQALTTNPRRSALLTLHATPGLRGSGVEPESLRFAVEIGANSRQ
jgi:hypothetical protein